MLGTAGEGQYHPSYCTHVPHTATPWPVGGLYLRTMHQCGFLYKKGCTCKFYTDSREQWVKGKEKGPDIGFRMVVNVAGVLIQVESHLWS